MFTIKTFEFNDFGVNTYLLSASNNECLVIDPGFYTKSEKTIFDNYLIENNLKLVRMLITHCHIDHILGITHVEDTYGISASLHNKGKEMLRASVGYGSVFGLEIERPITNVDLLTESELIYLGENKLKVLYTPGHADGSVCFMCHKEQFVITGDVLFHGSIGRTDLPTGNYQVLMKSIKEKLFTLDDKFIVYPGHGSPTTIGWEKVNNPYIE